MGLLSTPPVLHSSLLADVIIYRSQLHRRIVSCHSWDSCSDLEFVLQQLHVENEVYICKMLDQLIALASNCNRP